MGEEHTIVAVAMDDMAVTSKRAIDMERFKTQVMEFWDITDHGPIKWFQIKQDQELRTISINQCAYIDQIVEKFRLTNARHVSILMDANAQFMVNQCPLTLNQASQMIGVPYSEAIGSV